MAVVENSSVRFEGPRAMLVLSTDVRSWQYDFSSTPTF